MSQSYNQNVENKKNKKYTSINNKISIDTSLDNEIDKWEPENLPIKNNYNISNEDDIIQKLELEFQADLKKNIPKNYGNKWSDNEKDELIFMLKNCSKLQSEDKVNGANYLTKSEIIYNIGNKLGRTLGGIQGEIKRLIYNKYTNGELAEFIADDLNLIYRDVKKIIKQYVDENIDSEIKNLEKENKLFELQIQNKKLRNELLSIKST